jgi:hypothetical protein
LAVVSGGEDRAMPRLPVGWMLIVLALLHTMTALVLSGEPLRDIVEAGLIDTVRPPLPATGAEGEALRMTKRAFALWFLYAGFAFALLGLVIRDVEARGARIPRSLGYGLLALVAISAIVSPVSGMWLLLVPAWAVLRTARDL